MEFTCTKENYIDVLQNYSGEMTIKLTGEFEDFYDFVSDVNNYCLYHKDITLDLSEALADDYSISECPQIVSVIFPKDVRGKDWSVYGCKNLISVELPEYADDIKGYNPFSGCSKLEYLDIPDNVYFDPYYKDNGGADSNFYYIKNVSIGKNNRNYAVIDDIFLVDLRTNALVKVLSDNIAETDFDLVIPECITYIAPYAFAFVEGLTKITCHQKITGLGVAAFSDAEELKEICNMPRVSEFPNNCFESCENLCKVEIPDSVKYIGKDCFGSCKNLTEIEIPESVEILDSYAFRSTGLKGVIIPESVKKMGERCFVNCYALKIFAVLPGIKKLGDETLYGCTALQEVHLPRYMLFDEKDFKHVTLVQDADDFSKTAKIIFDL